MKKSFLFAIVMLALSLSASAQYKGFAFGVKMGPAFDWAGSKTNMIHNEGTRMGFRWGLLADYYFSENYAIVTGLNVNYNRGHYSYEDMRNFTIEPDTVPSAYLGEVDRLYKATVFEIPVALKMVTEEFGPFSFFAQMGGSLGFTSKALAKDSFKRTELPEITSQDENYDPVKYQYNPFHVALNAAIGAQFIIKGSTRAFADLYYSRDLLNGIEMIKYSRYYNGDKTYPRDSNEKLDYRQNILGLEVGILF